MKTESRETNTSDEFPERWTTERLAAEMPGTTSRWWGRKMVPELVRRGALRKVWGGWVGRRSDIVAALLTAGVE